MVVHSFMAVYKIELKAQGRPNLADGISLYVSDDRKVATWSLAGCEYVHGKQLVLYELNSCIRFTRKLCVNFHAVNPFWIKLCYYSV